ncbi:MAG: hypothetical protein JWQ36_1175 [Enterovirga sp.]|nr:hypothetical protein [Enterovirga sp.]
MALETRHNPSGVGPEFELRDDDRFTGYEVEREPSHFGAFLMGGMVVAGGLLAFLYYDTDNLNGRMNGDLTTGSITRTDVPAVPSLKLPPANPDGAGKP